MSSSGGEILRAVMEASSVYSNPSLYCIPLNGKDGTGNATTSQRAYLQLHKTLWFMATAIVPTATESPGFERVDQPEFIRLFDPSDNREYAKVPLQMQYSLYGDATINNPLTLPEYLVFEPGGLIGVEWTGRNFAAEVGFKFLTLLGIEYGMKD